MMDYVNPLTLLLIFVPWIALMLIAVCLQGWGSDGSISNNAYGRPSRYEKQMQELWETGEYTGKEYVPWSLVTGIQLTLKGLKLLGYFIGTYSGAVMIWLVYLVVVRNL